MTVIIWILGIITVISFVIWLRRKSLENMISYLNAVEKFRLLLLEKSKNFQEFLESKKIDELSKEQQLIALPFVMAINILEEEMNKMNANMFRWLSSPEKKFYKKYGSYIKFLYAYDKDAEKMANAIDEILVKDFSKYGV